MAQRENLAGMVIPGVTDVDPGMREPSLAGSVLGAQARMGMLAAVGHSAGSSAQIAAVAATLPREPQPAPEPDDELPVDETPPDVPA